jgi:hypothetical protein
MEIKLLMMLLLLSSVSMRLTHRIGFFFCINLMIHFSFFIFLRFKRANKIKSHQLEEQRIDEKIEICSLIMSSRSIRIFVLFLNLFQLLNKALAQDQNAFQYLIEQTNYLIYNSSSIIEDTTSFFPSYDFIIVVSTQHIAT